MRINGFLSSLDFSFSHQTICATNINHFHETGKVKDIEFQVDSIFTSSRNGENIRAEIR